MQDVEAAYARLESPLLGALIHAATVTAPVVDATVTAAHIYASPVPPMGFFVDARRLALSAEQLKPLETWPKSADSLFAHAVQWGWTEACFRPQHALTSRAGEPSALFGPLNGVTRVVDCVCVSFRLTSSAWCLIAFLRCSNQPAFAPRDTASIEQIKPMLARVVQDGLRRERAPRAGGAGGSDDFAATAPTSKRSVRQSPDELFKSLSKTEQQILPHLRSAATEREIAQAIHRSPHTVHVHVKNIYRKLGIGSRRELQELFSA